MRRLVLLILLCLIAIPAYASVVLAYDLPTLTKDAELVVKGTVKKTESKWVGKRIVTEVTLTIDQTLKGSPASSEVVLYTLGGVVDGVGMKVSGMATFTPKEEVVVFLKSYKGNYSTLGLGQGKYKLTLDAKGNKIATPEVDGLSLVKRLPDGTLSPTELPKPLSFTTLESEIKRLAR